MNIFLPLILIIILYFFIHCYQLNYINNALPEKILNQNNDICIFSFESFLRFGLFNSKRGCVLVKICLYPKNIIIYKGNRQRTVTSTNIYFDKMHWTNCIKIHVPEMSYPITIELTNNQYRVMQKYIEIINTYDSEEDIINHFERVKNS